MSEHEGLPDERREELARWFHPEAFDCEWNVSVFGSREQAEAQAEAYRQADALAPLIAWWLAEAWGEGCRAGWDVAINAERSKQRGIDWLGRLGNPYRADREATR